MIKRRSLLILFISWVLEFNCYADRIYVMNATGYNTAEPQLINAIISNGHTVIVNNSNLNTLPTGFTTSCIDPINGYDWLCFFGNTNFSGLTTQIQAFVDAGGKVYYQYEISCCVTSSNSISTILSSLTGTSITPNSNPYIAFNNGNAGFTATNISCCASFIGDAYKGLDGLPLANQIQATSTLSGATPPIGTCLNFGFSFSTTDFAGTANSGAIIGFGDMNIWYDGDEPFWNGGTTSVNTSVVDYIFPNNSSFCYAFPPGCIDTTNNPTPTVDLGNDTTLCQGETLTLNATTTNATYLWQDNSSNPTFNVTQQGTYWVQITDNCGSTSDTINVNFNSTPTIDLGNDTTLCQDESITLDATTPNATYLWQDNSINPTFNVTQQDTYSVEVTVNNCTLTDTILIDKEACDIILEIPNVFTPNNDGSNDLFVPVMSKGIISMNTIIYNRWGNKIFDTNNLLIDWNGKNVSDGTYFWIVNYTDINGVKNNLKGHVTILK